MYQSHRVTDLMCPEIACRMNVVIIMSTLFYQSQRVTDLMCQEIACTMNVVIIISKICVVTSCDLVLCRLQAGSCVRDKSVQIRKIGEIHQRRREVSGKQVQGVQEVNTRNHS